MRILTFTTLYPNAVRPQFGIFVETRLRHLVASGRVSARVVAPCPWFPSTNPRFGDYAEFPKIPAREERHGIAIDHPRYPVIPKVGMSIAASLLFTAVLPVIRRQIASGQDFDVIDAHYMYPDGVAAAMLGRALGRPVVITCRGTDLNVIAEFLLPRMQIRWAARRAAALVTVSRGLRERLTHLGVSPNRVRVLRNGVDLERFRPGDRIAGRTRLSLTGQVLLSVGNLVALKGHDLVIKALPSLPETTLLIVGRGPERGALEELAHTLGVEDRVRFLGALPQERLPDIYGAADVLILASSSEGWPNVLLESMACGTPVIASNLPGPAELINVPEAGLLLAERTPTAIADAVRRLAAGLPAREVTRRYAEEFGWESTTAGQLEIFEEITKRSDDHA